MDRPPGVPRAFWTGNAASVRGAAYYGTFIALRTYLIRAVGLDDVQAGIVGRHVRRLDLPAAVLQPVPPPTGSASGKALMLAFGLLAAGYGTLGLFHTLGRVLLGLALIVSARFVKPVITGTVTKTSTPSTAPRPSASSTWCQHRLVHRQDDSGADPERAGCRERALLLRGGRPARADRRRP